MRPDRLVLGHGSEAELSLFTGDSRFRLDRIIRWTTDSRTITLEDIAAERQRLAAPYENLDPAMRRQFVEPLVSEERPVADVFPAFQGVMLGRDGRIWIREHSRPTGPETQQWVAFAADGRFECRATLPALDQILELGDDYLLALDRDESGVERVVQYSIVSPTE